MATENIRYPGDTGRFRLSNSDVQTYLACGVRYQFRREDRTRRTTVRMAIGTAVAYGAKNDNETKLALNRSLPIADIVDLSVTCYKDETSESEVAESKSEIAGGVDDTAAAARTFATVVSPWIQPIAAEKPVVVQLGDDLELAGRFDYATKEGIGDLKCGREWAQDRADRTSQLTAYGLVFKALYKADPSRVWIDSVYRAKGSWLARRFWSSRSPEEYEAFYRLLKKVAEAIKAGIALPAAEGDFRCSPKWCEFWNRCLYVSHNKGGQHE